MACRGKCKRLEAYTKATWQFFVDGRRYCTDCMMAYRTPAKYCACCNRRLRVGPRRSPNRIMRREALLKTGRIREY